MRTNMNDIKYISKEKKAELEEELNLLKTTKRKEILDSLEYARSLGDLSENAEYHQAREDQAKLEDRINKVEEILRESVLVKKHTGNVVELGTTVTIKKSGDKEKRVYTIVGGEEADTLTGKISNNSPLGLALIGHKVGDIAQFETPKGINKYEILDIA